MVLHLVAEYIYKVLITQR